MTTIDPVLRAVREENAEGRVTGWAVDNPFNAIRGAFARFVNPKGAFGWDLPAGIALAREAGCRVIP